MTIIKLRSGHVLKEDDRITYFIPLFSKESILPVDLTVLEVAHLRETPQTGRKYYEAYKANITADSLVNWKREKRDEDNIAAADLKDALNGNEAVNVLLQNTAEGRARLEFSKAVGKQKQSVGSINLERSEILPSFGKLLETVILNLMETAEENSELRTESVENGKKQLEFDKSFRNLAKSKTRMEDTLTRAFMRALNTKKDRIVQLEKQIEALKRSKGPGELRRATRQKYQSSDSEGEKLSDQAPTTDYDEETDIQDSDDDTSAQSKVKLLTLNSQDEMKTSCRKNLFPTDGCSENQPSLKGLRKPTSTSEMLDGSQTDSSQEFTISSSRKKPSAIKAPGKNPAVANNDSQTDSSQEFFVPPPKIPKIPMPTRRALKKPPPKPEQESQIIDEDETGDEDDFEQVPEPDTKKSRTDAIPSSSKISSSSDDDLLEKIFAFDSQ